MRLVAAPVATLVVTVLVVFPLSAVGTADDTVGLVNPESGEWLLRHEVSLDRFFYGDPGDVPLMGDWDCDGIDTPGLYRQSDGFVYLRNSNTQGIADIRFFFGNPSDVPLAGDFDGDGCDTVSIYRPSESRVFIIDSLGADEAGLGAAALDYYFGNPGDQPFVGDFDGDGIDTVGLHRESTGLVYFRNSHTQGVAEEEFVFGDPGDRLVAGDWNQDGKDSPALFRPIEGGDSDSPGKFFFRLTNTQGTADAEFCFSSGWPQGLPVAGDIGKAAPFDGALVDCPALTSSVRSYSAAEIDYFVEIGLGAEFGSPDPVVHRWTEDVRIAVFGSPTAADLGTLDLVLADLNRIIDPIEVGRGGPNPNVEIHFEPLSEFPVILPEYIPGNVGFFSIWWGPDGALFRAVILVATDAITEAERAHVIREEVTQSLGLANDSYLYPDSIFQQAWTTTTSYAPIDEAVISILYDPRIDLLMTEAEVRAALR